MTPKEKAETLIHKYRMLLMNDGEDFGEEILVTKLSIESALITVDEILIYTNYSHYWEEDKQELEKL